MTTTRTTLLAAVGTLVALAAAAGLYVRVTGLVARGEPGRLEARVARAARSLAVPPAVRDRSNPVALTPDVLAEGLAHFADHCAVCHGNDGSGNTPVGQGTWPKAPDMRLEATQRLTDGELFHIIEQGIRFTAMPGWSTGTPEGAASSWHLVHFIRHLPAMTSDELERVGMLTPRSPDEIRQEIEAEQFLQGGDPAPPVHQH
jgi:mono/diheme cytochrome c family protein